MSSTHSQISERLSTLRKAMTQAGLDAWILPSTDPHQSEYVAQHWRARDYFSGFTGSAGTLVVTADHAGLWTDSRYYLQAEQQLPPGQIQLFRSQDTDTPTIPKWLATILPKNSQVGMDGRLLSFKEQPARKVEYKLLQMRLMLDHDLTEMAWENRPSLPQDKVFEHALHFAGKSRTEKIAEVRGLMAHKKADYHLISSLDDIAWLLNLRGSDVDFCPVFYAYLLVGTDEATLFIQPEKVDAALKQVLAGQGVEIAPYDAVRATLQSLHGNLLADPATTAFPLLHGLPEALRVAYGATLTVALKARKNPTEIAHIHKAMIKDGVALLRLFRWIEANLDQGITEMDVSDRLCALRAAQADYFGESFPAIAGYAANGAIVHYRPERETAATLRKGGIFLLDSGGQYHDGTTDITRTVALGTPTPAQVRAATLVLKGHIALAMAQFPYGVGGYQLDVLSRIALWKQGLNYGHGTGHGVGFFLNVHEGPQSIRHGHSERSAVTMEPGMLTSNEPGYYEAGEFGVRIENLILCVELESTAYGRFLGFETLSLCPIDLDLVEADLLESTERAWLNDYHARVMAALAPHLDGEEKAWLSEKCRPI